VIIAESATIVQNNCDRVWEKGALCAKR